MLSWPQSIIKFATLGLAVAVFLPKMLVWIGFLSLLVGSLGSSSQFFQHRLALPAMGLALWLTLSALWSDVNDSQSWHNWFYYCLVVAVPLTTLALIKHLPAQTRVTALRWFMLASAAATLIYAGANAASLKISRPFEYLTLYDGNKSILFQILAVVGCSFLLIDSLQKERRSLVWAALAAICLVLLMVTIQSRTAFLIAIVALVFAVAAAPIDRRGKWIALLLSTVIIAVTLSSSGRLQARIQSAVEGITLQGPADRTNSMNVRKAMNEHSLSMIQSRPLIGHGLGSWTHQWKEQLSNHGHLPSLTAHDEYLSLGAQTGLIGTALLVWFFLAFANAARALTGPAKFYGLIMAGAWLIASAFNATLRDAAFALPMLFLSALVLSQPEKTLARDSSH
jgi:O-antigen ligase